MIALDVGKLRDLVTSEFASNPALRAELQASPMNGVVTRVESDPSVSGEWVKSQIAGLSGTDKTKYHRIIRLLQELQPGVDEEKAGLVTYRGFKSRVNGKDKLQRVKDAWARITDLLTTCNRYMSYVRDPNVTGGYYMHRAAGSDEEKRATALYQTWFDKSLSHTRISSVRANFTNLFKAVTAQEFEIICDGDAEEPNGVCGSEPGWFGFVMKADNRNRFYVSELFFNELTQQMGGNCSLSVSPAKGKTWQSTKSAIYSALDASVITMLHELTHIKSLTDTDDVKPDPYGITFCKGMAENYPDYALQNAENYAQFSKDVLLKIQFAPPKPVRI